MNAIDRFSTWSPGILGAQRFIAGIMFICYGAMKVFDAFGGIPPQYKTLETMTAGWIEVIGGALIAVGLFTRFTAFICSGEMAVAYFKGHAMGNSFWPIVNKGELAILFCWMFLYYAAAGPGRFALDNLIRRRKVPAGNVLS
jgi:putative oxidoreductase